MTRRIRIAGAFAAMLSMATETCANCGAVKRVGKACRYCGKSCTGEVDHG